MNRYRSRVLAVKRKTDAAADREDWVQSFSIIPDFDLSTSDYEEPMTTEESAKDKEPIQSSAGAEE